MGQARRWIDTLIEIARWMWCASLALAIIGLMLAQYLMAALSGLAWLAALTVTACGRRASKYIAEEERIVAIHDARARVKPSFWKEQI